MNRQSFQIPDLHWWIMASSEIEFDDPPARRPVINITENTQEIVPTSALEQAANRWQERTLESAEKYCRRFEAFVGHKTPVTCKDFEVGVTEKKNRYLQGLENVK